MKLQVALLGFHKIGVPPNGWWTWNYIPEETFDCYMAYLRDNDWSVVDIDTFLRGLDEPESHLPGRSVLLTFDDGYRSFRNHALPILSRYGYSSVIFVPTDFIGRFNMFDRDNEPEEAICDWNDLLALNSEGVSIQSHGCSHRRFSSLCLEEQKTEIVLSKDILEQRLGHPVNFFSFPYGDQGAWEDRLEEVFRSAGYKAACLYGDGLPPEQRGRYRLARIAMGPDTNLSTELAKYM